MGRKGSTGDVPTATSLLITAGRPSTGQSWRPGPHRAGRAPGVQGRSSACCSLPLGCGLFLCKGSLARFPSRGSAAWAWVPVCSRKTCSLPGHCWAARHQPCCSVAGPAGAPVPRQSAAGDQKPAPHETRRPQNTEGTPKRRGRGDLLPYPGPFSHVTYDALQLSWALSPSCCPGEAGDGAALQRAGGARAPARLRAPQGAVAASPAPSGACPSSLAGALEDRCGASSVTRRARPGGSALAVMCS